MRRPAPTPAPARDGEGSDETRVVLDALRHLMRDLRDFSTTAERIGGVSGAQLFALEVLARHGPMSVSELAERTHTHQSSVSVVATKLVGRGLAEKTPSRRDGRVVELAVTPRGRRLLSKTPSPVQNQLIGALEAMPSEDRHRLAQLLMDLHLRIRPGERGPAPMFFERSPEPKPKRRRKQ